MFQQGNKNSSDMKRSMFLDLGGENDNSKQKPFQNILGSQMLLGNTPTPTQFTFPKYVTDEQEAYARGFVEALAELHTDPDGMPVSTSSNSLENTPNQATYSTLTPMTSVFANMTQSNSMQSGYQSNTAVSRRHPPFALSGLASSQTQYSTITSSYSPKVKSEPLSDRAKSPISDDSDSQTESNDSFRENNNRLDAIPLDLNVQERLKLERKRAKNRIAARKCRTRKLETISRLEEKVEGLKSRNQELSQTTNCLQEQLRLLKQQVMEHMKTGCSISIPDLRHNNMAMVQAQIH